MTRPAIDVRAVGDLRAEGLNNLQIERATGIRRATFRPWLRDGIDRTIARRAGVSADCGSGCPRIVDLPRPEYAYLLGLYLGDGTISVGPRGVYRLRIFCCDAYPRLMDRCEEAVRLVMPTNRVGRTHGNGCTAVGSTSKHWPCVFPQAGAGMKHFRPITLTDWQSDILQEFPRDAIEGLIHSDGCRALNKVVRNGKRYVYPRYFFSNRSGDIVGIFTRCCDLLGVEWRMNNSYSVSVARRASVAILDSFVEPKT